MSAVVPSVGVVPRARVCSRNGNKTKRSSIVSHAFGARGSVFVSTSKAVRTKDSGSSVDVRKGCGGCGNAPGHKAPVDTHRGSVVANGLPVPIIGGLFNPMIMSIIYVFVAIRFALNYNKTSFTQKNKAMMIGLWPVLAVTSASFRENLKKATMG